MQYPATLRLGAAALATLTLLAACNSDNNTSPPATSMVRVVNASSADATLGATVGSTALATGLDFQNSNATASCTTINSGSQAIAFTGANGSLGSTTFTFLPGQSYTVVFFGSNNAVVFPETFTAPSAGNMGLRFINATGTAGDLFLTTPTGTISGTPTVANLAAGQVSGFNATSAPGGVFVNTFPAANTRVRLFNVGTITGTPRADFTIGAMGANRVGTVVLTPAAGGSTSTGFLVSTCR